MRDRKNRIKLNICAILLICIGLLYGTMTVISAKVLNNRPGFGAWFLSILCVVSGVLYFAFVIYKNYKVKNGNKNITTGYVNIIHEDKYGDVFVGCKVEDFLKLGFEFGDSVSVKFSNGYEKIDIPFYDGYHLRSGEFLVCAYPGYVYVDFSVNNGGETWSIVNATAETTCEISLFEKGKYRNIQEVCSQKQRYERDEFDSDESFSNFRPFNVGNVKKNLIYRGASPINNLYNRVEITDKLCKNSGIKYFLNLSETWEEVETHLSELSEDSYTKTIYESGEADALGLNSDFRKDAFRKKLGAGLLRMIDHDGPYYLHCIEGKDRTGFTCIILGLLLGGTREDIENDYMVTYKNLFNIDKSTKDKYYAIRNIKFGDYILEICGRDDIDNVSDEELYNGAIRYLKTCGLDNEDIERLKNALGG